MGVWPERGGVLWRARRLCLVFLDLLGWLIFLELSAVARYDGHVGSIDQVGLLGTAGADVSASKQPTGVHERGSTRVEK